MGTTLGTTLGTRTTTATTVAVRTTAGDATLTMADIGTIAATTHMVRECITNTRLWEIGLWALWACRSHIYTGFEEHSRTEWITLSLTIRLPLLTLYSVGTRSCWPISGRRTPKFLDRQLYLITALSIYAIWLHTFATTRYRISTTYLRIIAYFLVLGFIQTCNNSTLHLCDPPKTHSADPQSGT